MSRLRQALLWAALAAAFSPVLADWVAHLAEEPWARYAALFPLLCARCALREPRPERERTDGTLLVALGLALALLAVFAGEVRYGRPGCVLAAIGLGRRFALASGSSLALLALAIPVPTALLAMTSPELPEALLQVAAKLLAPTGLAIRVDGMHATVGAHALELERFDGGLALVPLLAGLAWYASLMLRRPRGKAVIRAGVAALLAIPLQAAALVLALPVLGLGEPVVARRLLTHLPWVLVSLLALSWTELRVRKVAHR